MRAAVFSGGGARCAAQLGYMQRLYEKGVEFEEFGGSSGGAVVAAMLAAGFEPLEALSSISQKRVLRYLKPAFFRGALFDSGALRVLFEELGIGCFTTLRKSLFVTVCDYESMEPNYLRRGDLCSALAASCALMPIFSPLQIGGRSYIDGGFADNLPVRGVENSREIWAFDVNPPYEGGGGFFRNFKRACYIAFNSGSVLAAKTAQRYVLIKECVRYGIFSFENLDKIYMLGYDKAIKDGL